MTTDTVVSTPTPASRVAVVSAWIALAIIPVNFGVWLIATLWRDPGTDWSFAIFTLLALGQLACGLVALVSGLRARFTIGRGLGPAVAGALAAAGAVGGWVLGIAAFLALSGAGGAWGRPLRIRGRQRHPELKEGSDWTRGDRPDAGRLDEGTRRALEALWLHDAQKEHASVPAFSRISWMLAAVGAPAELIEWSHRAALEEIEHTRLCFALAAGYGGRSYTVQPMPELLDGGLDLKGSPLGVLAAESLCDGCQLEDFNADVAAECAQGCEEPATRAVLERIAREERTHADFSWALVAWLLERDRARVQPTLERALASLERYRRPTAVSWDKRALVERADPAALRAHGRLPDERWSDLWDQRLRETRLRALVLISLGAAPSSRSA
jgi:hypothetical protein